MATTLADTPGPRHFLLVHGACHGAWCWYKTISLLHKEGHKATALDLTGCGRDNTDPATVTSVAHLAQPVLRFVQELPSDEKVILVGHSFGGVIVSYVMERFPDKISTAVFITAMMLPSRPGAPGHKATHKFFSMVTAKFSSMAQNARTSFIGPGHYELFYHLCPPEDVTLASLLLRPFPNLGLVEIETPHTSYKYGSVNRVFIRCTRDLVFPVEVADVCIQSNPPARVFDLDADHSPFFSAPESLHHYLLEIAASCPPMDSDNKLPPPGHL